jgi:hypothetical protein
MPASACSTKARESRVKEDARRACFNRAARGRCAAAGRLSVGTIIPYSKLELRQYTTELVNLLQRCGDADPEYACQVAHRVSEALALYLDQFGHEDLPKDHE